MLIFIGVTKAYAGTSHIIMSSAVDSKESVDSDHGDRPDSGSSGCTRC